MNFDYKKYVPYLGIFVLFVAISFAYFSPQLEGKKLDTHDQKMWLGGAKESIDFRERTGQEPLWSNSMFSGMPAYYVSIKYPANLFRNILTATKLGIDRPAIYVIWSMVYMFILLMVLGADKFTGVVGAVAYSFSSYNFVIMAAGHFAKVMALSFLPGILAGVILIRKGKYLAGFALSAVMVSFELIVKHPQMTYYFFVFFLLIYFLFDLVDAVKKKELKAFVIYAGLFAGAVILGILPNASQLLVNQEYTPYSTRGKSELTIVDKEDKTTGLDRSYITAWSNDIAEVFALMIPNAKGGASRVMAEEKTAMKAVDRRFKSAMKGVDAYWGNQPFTGGPMYAGAIVVFLFVLGWFLVDGTLKWSLITAAVITTMLSWGHNFPGLTNWFIDHFPLYNKFRAVASIEIVTLFAIPLLAGMVLMKIYREPGLLGEPLKLFGKETKYKNLHAFWAAFLLTGGLSLVFWLMPTTFFDFFKADEYENYLNTLQKNGWKPADIDDLMASIEAGRVAIFKADAIRSFAFILIGASVLFAALKRKIDVRYAFAGLAFLVLVDMWGVNKRYLNDDNFVREKNVENPFPLTKASEHILQDKSPMYRVLNLSVSTFNETSTSYYHKSIGGYNGAKLKKYQELIDFYISKEMQKFLGAMRNARTMSDLEPVLSDIPVLNMLNAKYIIYNPDQPPVVNRHIAGPAWFVDDVKWVESADEEMLALGETDLQREAVIRRDQAENIGNFQKVEGFVGKISLIEHEPNRIVYQSSGSAENIAVFSEIWYPKGWIATIDGEEVPIGRANYLLRTLKVPAGEHEIIFEFKPDSYIVGEKISLAGSVLMILVLLGAVWKGVKGGNKND